MVPGTWPASRWDPARGREWCPSCRHCADSRAPQVDVVHLRSLCKGQDRSLCVAPGHCGRHSGLFHASRRGQLGAGKARLPPAGAGSSLQGGGAILGAAGTSPDCDWTMWQPEPHEGAAGREWATSHDGLVPSPCLQPEQPKASVGQELPKGWRRDMATHSWAQTQRPRERCLSPSAAAAADVGAGRAQCGQSSTAHAPHAWGSTGVPSTPQPSLPSGHTAGAENRHPQVQP